MPWLARKPGDAHDAEASRKLAEAYLAETGQQDLAAMAESIRGVFPDALFSYAHLRLSIHKVLM